MEYNDFKLVSKDSFHHSKTNRIVTVIFFMLIIVMFSSHLYDKFDLKLTFPKTLYIILDILTIIGYSLFIISYIINRNILFRPVSIEITKDLIKLKKDFKKEVKILNVQIEYIRIIDFKLIIKISNRKFYFNINIFEDSEIGHLKFKLREFCKLNDIEFKLK